MNDASAPNNLNKMQSKEMSTCFKTEPPDTEFNESTSNPDYSNDFENHDIKVKIEKEWAEIQSTSTGEEVVNSKKIKMEGSTTQYTCGICEFLSDTFLEMREHRKSHNVEKRTCAMCGMVCQSIGERFVIFCDQSFHICFIYRKIGSTSKCTFWH